MSAHTPRKRGSMEPAEALLAREPGLPANAKRPATTSLGAYFVLFRALAGLLWIAVFWLQWDEVAPETGLDPHEDQLVLWTVVILGVAASLVLLGLAVAVWLGNNPARVLVMLGLTASTIAAAVGYFVNNEQITIHTTLITLSLDILVLLALSSRSSRAWARRAPA